MNLLMITQRVDEHDANLANHVRWLQFFSEQTQALTVITQSVGTYHLPANTHVCSLGKESGAPKWKQFLTFFQQAAQSISRVDAVFVLMSPLYVILIAPLAFFYRKKIYLWYTHKYVSWTLRIAEWFVTNIFSASPESFRLSSHKVIFTGHAIDTDFFSPDARVGRDSKKSDHRGTHHSI